MQQLPPRTRPHASPIVPIVRRAAAKAVRYRLQKRIRCVRAHIFGYIRIGSARFRYFRPQTADLCKRGFSLPANLRTHRQAAASDPASVLRTYYFLRPDTRSRAYAELSPRPSVPLPRLKKVYRAKARTGAFQKSYPREQSQKRAASIYR